MKTPLQKAAQALIDKWTHSHPLKECAVLELREALDAEIAQSVEPVAWYEHNPDLDAWCLAYSKNPNQYIKSRPLYLHPPQPQATTAVPEGYVLVPIEPTEKMIVDLMCTGLRHAEYKPGCDPTIAHMAQGYTAMIAAAAQGEKP